MAVGGDGAGTDRRTMAGHAWLSQGGAVSERARLLSPLWYPTFFSSPLHKHMRSLKPPEGNSVSDEPLFRTRVTGFKSEISHNPSEFFSLLML